LVVAFTAHWDREMLRYKYKQLDTLVETKLYNIMAQILDPLPVDTSNHILCCYVNASNQIQVARITNIRNWYFERVIFPGQRLVFESLPEGLLEIHTGMMASAILSDTIPCYRLQLEAINSFGEVPNSKTSPAYAVSTQSSSQSFSAEKVLASVE
jgi:Domain of unknown function (DUF1830)